MAEEMRADVLETVQVRMSAYIHACVYVCVVHVHWCVQCLCVCVCVVCLVCVCVSCCVLCVSCVCRVCVLCVCVSCCVLCVSCVLCVVLCLVCVSVCVCVSCVCVCVPANVITLAHIQDYLATKYVMESSGTKALRSREGEVVHVFMGVGGYVHVCK